MSAIYMWEYACWDTGLAIWSNRIRRLLWYYFNLVIWPLCPHIQWGMITILPYVDIVYLHDEMVMQVFAIRTMTSSPSCCAKSRLILPCGVYPLLDVLCVELALRCLICYSRFDSFKSPLCLYLVHWKQSTVEGSRKYEEVYGIQNRST